MRALCLVLALPVLLLPSWSHSQQQATVIREVLNLGPFRAYVPHGDTLPIGQPVQVIAAGRNTGDSLFGAALGVYEFDGRGNCVAWDDADTGVLADRCAIEFIPERSSMYFLEVHNLGRNWNRIDLAVRKGAD